MWSQSRDNKVRYFERYFDPLTGKQKTVSCTFEKDTAGNRKRALSVLQEKIDARCHPAKTENLTLKDLVDRYAKHQSHTVKSSTAKRNSYEAKAVLTILGADSLVDRLTVAYVTERLLAAEEIATCTNARIKYIKALIRWAHRSDLINSPALADKLQYLQDSRRKEKLQTKYMEPEELEAVLDAMTVTRWKLLTEFLCLSGLRIGELIALNDADVTDYIHISKTYDLRTETVSETPKTETSNRDVFIQEELADCIEQMRIERKKMLLKSGKRSDLFYPDPDGKYMHYPAFNKYLKENTQVILGRALTPHACRHTMTSIFAAQGVDLGTISRRLGHATSEITRQIYLHQTAEQQKRDERQIEKIRFFT